MTYLKNASNVVEVFDSDGQVARRRSSQPGIGAAALAAEDDRTEAYLTFTSFNYPTTIFRVDLAKPAAAPELWEQPDVPVDPSIVEVEQVWYPSKDGTQISMFLVHKKGLRARRRRRRRCSTGYGGFNVSETPAFSRHAVPVVRGRRPVTRCRTCAAAASTATPGTKPGMLEQQAERLRRLHRRRRVADRATATRSPSKLAITGGSNGGLLTGAASRSGPTCSARRSSRCRCSTCCATRTS